MMKRLVIIVVVALMAAPSFGQLAGYWKFDEGAGTTAADSSGKGNPGVLQKNGTGALPQWTTGHNGTGGALTFNATTTSSADSDWVFVDINNLDAVAKLGTAFTISMWVRSDQTQDWVLRVPTGNWRWLVYTNAYDLELAQDPSASGLIAFDYLYSDTSAPWQLELGYETDAQNVTGSWYHLAVTFDRNFLRKYVNGSLVLTIPAPAESTPTATTDLFIAAMSGGSGYFAGELDDVAIWTGSYLPASEIAKLADGTATPLTAVDHAPEAQLPPKDWTLETNIGWSVNGAETTWCRGFNWDVRLSSNTAKTVWMADVWWADTLYLMPGTRSSVYEWNKWFPLIPTNDANIYEVDSNGVPNFPPSDVTKYGVEWIDPSWSGRDPCIAVIVAYITPGIAVCQNSWWIQPYDPCVPRAYNWEDKPYFKTYARIAGVHAQGSQFRVKIYSYPNTWNDPPNEWWKPLEDPGVLTYRGEVSMPLSGVDYQWQDLKFLLPKLGNPGGSTGVTPVPGFWFEASIVGGNANTVVYIDELSPVSDRYANFYAGDFDYDTVVGYKDLDLLTDEWLSSTVIEPRNSGMLVNGDFYADIDLLNMADDYNWVSATPTGWTFTGTADKGIQNMSKRGVMNYGDSAVATPLGASVAAYIIDDAVLQQTTAATMVAGHTYYAMAYVMTSSWAGWKDTATLTLEANGATLASFARPLSIERWRPVYGKYTAVPADAGKPIKIKLSYANTHTVEDSNSGYMFIGYAYLSDTMPPYWPEARANVLGNGGFDDLSAFEAGYPALVQSIRSSDNWGGSFVNGIPAPTSWLYEVPADYNLANKGGIWASGMYGSPLPTPGMTDVSMYTSNTLVLGQVVGPLANGTTYYLDTACGINSSQYILPLADGNGVNWPSPAPVLHIELWRIPAGVTSGSVIAAAIAGGNPSYVKVADANTSATGDIAGASTDRGTPSSKWQLIGKSYTATSLDTNMYVRVRGTGGAANLPEFAFSDVYLSPTRRIVPGGAITFNISSGMQSVTEGAYDCYHAGVMGLAAISADLDGNCTVNFLDFAIMAENWLKSSFTDATGFDGLGQDW